MHLEKSDTTTYVSVKKQKWKKANSDYSSANIIKQKLEIPFEVAEILSRKKISDQELIHYLDPKIKYFLSNISLIKDLDTAANLVINSIKNKEKITIFGDYDVDGATSSALIKKFLASTLKYNADIYIPDRITEGYGLSTNTLTDLYNKGSQLIITVDCGSSDYEVIKESKKLGLKIVVIDHHICKKLPDANAVVNPNRSDDSSGYNDLAAVGVSFIFVIRLYQSLTKEGLCTQDSFDLLSLLDLVALGTICDMVPLRGINRALVNQGLKIMRTHTNPGIKALLDISQKNSLISAYHLGFIIGPRINAGGRIGQSNLGSQLLSTNDHEEALAIAKKLDSYNEERKAIEMQIFEDAMSEAQNVNASSPIICIGNNNWHQGVIGIVAGKLKEIFNKPIAVISFDDNNLGKASCRSIEGIDFGSTLIEAKTAGLVLEGGGHAMAAGFTVMKDKLKDLNNFFIKSFQEKYNLILQHRMYYFDSHLSISSLNVEFIKEINKLGPFGSNNIQPRFMLNNVSVIHSNIVKGGHISCIITEIGKRTNITIQAIAFRAAHNILGEILLAKKYNLNLLVTLNINYWQNKENPQVIISDIFLNN